MLLGTQWSMRASKDYVFQEYIVKCRLLAAVELLIAAV
jgi:hypothetical protein